MLNNKILIFIFSIIFLQPLLSLGQGSGENDNYQYVQSLDPEMKRKVMANEVMFDKDEKYLIINYGNKPTYIIVYDKNTWKSVANFRLTNWVEFTGAYVDHETNQLYIKEGRYSNEYYRLDISNGQTDIVKCNLTPSGCPVIEPKQTEKEVYSKEMDFYITINKRNTRDVRVYQLKKKSN